MQNLILSSLYLFLPAYIANMSPVIASALKLPFAKPINEKLFGSHKTYRGFFAGFSGAFLVLIIQTILFKVEIARDISILDYSMLKIPLYAFIFGIGALTGDLLKSFLKRRLGIKPGKAFFPLDQIDFIIGASVFLLPVFKLSIEAFIVLILFTPILHLSTNIIAYLLGLKKVWY